MTINAEVVRLNARIAELEDALRPFARLAVADEYMAGVTPSTLRASVAVARTALASQPGHCADGEG